MATPTTEEGIRRVSELLREHPQLLVERVPIPVEFWLGNGVTGYVMRFKVRRLDENAGIPTGTDP